MRIRGTHNSRRRIWRAIPSVLLLFIATASYPLAEDYQLLRIAGQPVSWRLPDKGHLELTYAIVQDEVAFDGAVNCGRMHSFHDLLKASGLNEGDLTRALEQAFARWQSVINVTFVAATPGETPQIVLGAQSSPIGTAFTNVRLLQSDSSTRTQIVGGAICLNPERHWKVGFDGNLSSFDLEHVFTHEIGHILGLDHPGARGHVMAFRYLETNTALSEGDIAGAVHIYGPRSQTVVSSARRTARFAHRAAAGQAGPEMNNR